MFQGYWNDREATRNALTDDGWLRTGDIAVVDDDGFLYLVDRAKDLIIVSGFNVFPAEVEEVILDHPGVDAVAVVGVAHPHSGEAVKAYVVVAPRRVGRGGRHHRVLRRPPGPLQVPGQGDVRGRAPAEHRRQGPPPGSALGRGPASVVRALGGLIGVDLGSLSGFVPSEVDAELAGDDAGVAVFARGVRLDHHPVHEPGDAPAVERQLACADLRRDAPDDLVRDDGRRVMEALSLHDPSADGMSPTDDDGPVEAGCVRDDRRSGDRAEG